MKRQTTLSLLSLWFTVSLDFSHFCLHSSNLVMMLHLQEQGMPDMESVQSLSCVRLFETPWSAAHQTSLSYQLLELAQTHVLWVGDAIQPSSSVILFSFCLQSFPASGSLYLFLTFFALSPSLYSILIHICYANVKIPSIVPNISPSLIGKKQILPKKKKKKRNLRTCVKQSINSLYTEGLKKCKI